MRDKREREKQVVKEMITLYCRAHHERKSNTLCPECAALLTYAHERSDKCPHMENKAFCSSCKTHCYRSDMREKIRTIMRYSGPRMLTVHPILTIRHLIESRIEKHQLSKHTSTRE